MYPEEHFIEKPVKEAMAQFRKNLDTIISVIAERNKNKKLPYYYLSPDRIPNSVAIWVAAWASLTPGWPPVPAYPDSSLSRWGGSQGSPRAGFLAFLSWNSALRPQADWLQTKGFPKMGHIIAKLQCMFLSYSSVLSEPHTWIQV